MKGLKIGLNSILDSAFPTGGPVNGSDDTNVQAGGFSPSTLLETFIPGYSHIHRILLVNFGFDVTLVVSFGAALWVSARILKSVWTVLAGLMKSYFMAEITVSSKDEIHGHLIQFLAHQYKISSSRRLMAETPSKSAWELDNEDTESPETSTDATGQIKWLNFSNQEAKSQPRFTPAIGSHNFWFDGTYFQLKRKEVSVLDEIGGGGAAAFKDKEVLTLSCFGRSTDSIKRLIQHAKGHYHLGHKAKTIIKRPAPKDLRRFGGRGSWVKIAERPCRPMKTVVLDEARKMDVLADINEYLNPTTARWYANRGIPYRRGYLFYGPPGTGKTSLTFALAGVFGLDIHVVSLLEPTLTEEELGMLFTNLPARCIVLLEDIDTAGLIRVEAPEETTESDDKRDFNVGDLTKAFKKARVASHEGRVLVMTTNHPEKLDEALIRPGRVDHQVPFSHASQTQIKELFERMYTDDLPTTKIVIAPDSQSDVLTPPMTPISVEFEKNGHGGEESELEDIARRFSKKVPENMFSPAEIQGFLLKRKTEPRKALEEVGEWVRGMEGIKKGVGRSFGEGR
ncbi:P-loop containing nucleoside triphosphate hydrolase [Glarea lozoyensis ATCC 20868]|uniref:p-loop containing nucleoside triphosphate hydrolase n=1 Tax=Glarea lozoyensis (strain ATCC 20868 / MF5171) TaxID=1116229 RepID=S3CYG5_GLAL2|nr:P-loop containing nucleoside triphosphate hydrolase [Glarea lozoyensis ATCC 20868]EPE24851.1 P-loop containing nucleoside triphosphate hydrolase [Glarea lozoyensis ATCC 20868]